MGFLHFVPKTPPTVFGFLWASFQDCPLTPWLPSHYLCSERVCYNIPYLQTKYLVLFLLPLNCCPHQWIRIRLPHHLPLWHALSGPSPLLASFGQNATLARHFPKSRWCSSPYVSSTILCVYLLLLPWHSCRSCLISFYYVCWACAYLPRCVGCMGFWACIASLPFLMDWVMLGQKFLPFQPTELLFPSFLFLLSLWAY